MNILLLGGTGVIGESIYQYFYKENVYVTSRKVKKDKENVHYLCGNAMDNEFLMKCLSITKWDVIIDFLCYSTNIFKQRAELLTKGCVHYIFLSSARVYANNNHIIDEGSPRIIDTIKESNFLESDDYALSKARQEDILRELNHSNYTIVRPYITYGVNRIQLGSYETLQWLHRVVADKTIVLSQDIMERKTTLTYSFDVARMISEIAYHPKETMAEVFNVVGDTCCRWSDCLEIYKRILKDEYDIIINIKYVEKENDLPKGYLDYNKYYYDRRYDRVIGNSKLKSILGYRNNEVISTPIEQGLKSSLIGTMQNGVKYSIRNEAYFDRILAETIKFGEYKSIVDVIKYMILRYIFF